MRKCWEDFRAEKWCLLRRDLEDLICAAQPAGYGGSFGWKHGVSRQIGLLHLLDTSMTPLELYGNMFFFCCSIYVGVGGPRIRPLGGILSVHETAERLRELENVTRAWNHKVVSIKQVKCHFWSNNLFKVKLLGRIKTDFRGSKNQYP